MKGSSSHHQSIYCLKINEGTALCVALSTLIFFFFSLPRSLERVFVQPLDVQSGVMPVKSMIKMI